MNKINTDLVKYDDKVIMCNLMFFTRINKIVKWFEKFNEFIVSTHIKNDSDLEKIQIIDKPPVEISLTVLSKLDIAKFFTTDDNGETILDMLSRHQKYLQLQLNSYINLRYGLQKKLDKGWNRPDVLSEFNSYLLLLISMGNISKLALVNIKKREEVQKEIDKNPFKLTNAIKKKFNKLVDTYEGLNQQLTKFSRLIEAIYLETTNKNLKAEFFPYIKEKLVLTDEGLTEFTENVSLGDKDTLEIWDGLWKDYEEKIKKDFDEIQENELKELSKRLPSVQKAQQKVMLNLKREEIRKRVEEARKKEKEKEDARKKQLDENRKLAEKEYEETMRAEEMAKQLLEEEEMITKTKSKTKKKKKKKKKKKNKTKKNLDAPVSSPITVPPPSLKKEEPLMTPHDKVTLINPSLIENKELLLRQDITDNEIRNKSDFLKLCIWDIIMTELKSNAMISKNKLIFTGGFSTYIHTNGKYETDDIDCKIYPNNKPDDINKYNQALANYLKKFLTAKSQVFNLKLKQKFGQNIDFNFLASIIDIESGKFVDKVSGNDSKFVVKIAVSMPNPDDSTSDGGMWYPTIKKAYCDIGFWTDQIDGAITDEVGLPRLNAEQQWIPDVDIYGEISLLPVEYMILEKEILLGDTEYKYNTQWMIEHKKPRWEEQLRMLKSVRRKKGGKRTRRMRKKMRRKKKYRRTRKK